MSERPRDLPPDWRRQRQRDRGRGAATADRRGPRSVEAEVAPGEDAAGDSQEQVVASRTLASFLEPVIDTVAAFSAPVVIAGIVALITGTVLVAFVEALRFYGFIIMGLGGAMLGVMTLIYLSNVLAAFLSRTGRYGINALVMLAAFTGIIVVINFISFGNNTRIDVTATQQFSLATSTSNLLRELDQPIRAIAFYPEEFTNPQRDQQAQIVRRAKVAATLSEFRSRSNRISYEFRDPELFPELARNYGVTRYESIVIEGLDSGIVDIVQPTDQAYSELEQDLYTSILVASGQERRKVYFLTGHGQRSITATAGEGYSAIRSGLERDNYQVETLRWNPGNDNVSVPDDAGLLVIAGPNAELPEAHARALDSYLQGRNVDGTPRREGARLIFLAEPGTPDSFREFLARWGIIVSQEYIRDVGDSVPGSPHTMRVTNYNPDPVVRDIVQPRGTPLGVTFMPGAASLRGIDDGGPRVTVPLAISSPNSFLIRDINREDPVTEGEQRDPAGRFAPAMYMQTLGPIGTPPPPRDSEPARHRLASIVVFGDSDFVSNSFIDRGSGAAMFLNSANFLLGDYSLVSIRDRPDIFREFNLDHNQYNFVRFSSWFFLPGLMGLMAALVWWIRR